MTILPKIRTRFGEGIGAELFVQFPDLAENESTYLNTDAASGASSFTVDNGSKFAVGEYVVIGNPGSEKAEIVRIHTATTPTSTTITLNAVSVFAHNRGERVTFIPYNQIVLEKSTDGGSTYASLATVDIRADATETYYQDTTGLSTYYYRAKFSNSASSGVSSFSDGIISSGYLANSAGAVIRAALTSLGEKIDSEVITKEFLFQALDEGRGEVDRHKDVERWDFRTAFDYNAGSILPGMFQLALPTDIREGDTFKNVLELRVGINNYPVDKADKRRINDWYRGVSRSTLNGAITSGSTSIILTSSGDFDESGAVSIAGELVSDTIDEVDYTSNTPATNTLAGVTNIAGNHASGVVVWQGASFGMPVEFTIYEDKITFSQPFSNDEAGENVWLDYYKVRTRLDSDADLFDEPFYQIYIAYLRWRIKKRKNPSLSQKEDSDYEQFSKEVDVQAAKQFAGQDMRIEVDVPGGFNMRS